MLQLKLECSREEADAVSFILEENGALSVTLTDKADDPILEPELGTTPLWPQVVIHGLYADEDEGKLAHQLIQKKFKHLTCSLQDLPEQDWERVCLEDFKPLQFGKRLWVCPSWSTPPEPNAVNLILDPGLAFGTGTHATTALCLQWLDEASLAEKTVIDFGCGSGILALAALKLGAKHLYAVDLDEQALLATKSNAKINHLSPERLTIGLPDSLQPPVDLIIANILLEPLLQLKPRFRELLKKEGTLVVSGILEEQAGALKEAYQSDFIHQKTVTANGWGLIVFKL